MRNCLANREKVWYNERVNGSGVLPVGCRATPYSHTRKETAKMKGFWKDFKAFISKGNIIDLAVAVVVGGAFNKIVTSLVNDIVMPLIGALVGGLNVSDWKWVIKEAVYDEAGELVTAENAVMYGTFIQTIIDFLLVALTIFIVLRVIMSAKNKLHTAELAEAKAKEAEEAAAKQAAEDAAKQAEETKKAEDAEKLQLLREIRDSLKKR